MAKSAYIPKNIRQGMKIETLREVLKNYPEGKVSVHVETFDHGRDVCGNGTAHYTVYAVITYPNGEMNYPANIVSSGAKREQVGYSGRNEAALYALRMLGYDLDLSLSGSYDYEGSAYYPITNL